MALAVAEWLGACGLGLAGVPGSLFLIPFYQHSFFLEPEIQ